MQTQYLLDYNYLKQPARYENADLVQIGRRYCAPGEIVRKHTHIDWYELTIALAGSGEVRTNDEPAPISDGCVYLSFPGDIHEIVSSQNAPLKYDFISFRSTQPTLAAELRRIVSEAYRCEQRIFRDDAINAAVSLALSEIASGKKYCREIVSSLLDQLIFLTVRNFDAGTGERRNLRVSKADELCFQIMHYINTHVYSITSLAELSREFRFNYSYLSKLFRNTTNETISDYYQTRRLDVAKLLIAENELTISRIAEMLHYSSLYAFSKAFKNRYGVCPKQYRNSVVGP